MGAEKAGGGAAQGAAAESNCVVSNTHTKKETDPSRRVVARSLGRGVKKALRPQKKRRAVLSLARARARTLSSSL